jgi:uncharacterized membrane protein YdbT with pleckstrin-like domain
MPTILLPFERLVTRLHRHWILIVEDLVVPVFVLLVLVVGGGVLRQATGISADVLVLVTLATMAFFGLALIVAWVRWLSKTIMLTNQRVILLEGVVNKSTKVIPLERIQDIKTFQNLTGQIFNYGRVAIDATGTTESIDHLAAPEVFRDQVFLQIKGGKLSEAAEAER